MVTGSTSFNARQTWLKLSEKCQDLFPSQRAIECNLAIVGDTMNLENVLSQVQADCCNMHMGGSSQAVYDNCNMAHYDADAAGAIHTIRTAELRCPS